MNYCEKLKLVFGKRPFKLERPKVIQFPVIDICNSRCQMCRIWENKKSKDITVEQLRKGLSNKLFSEVTGIGFNGGEPTLRNDLKYLVQVAIDCLPALKHVSLITNAYKYKEVIARVEEVGLICEERNVQFDLMVSLDGYEEIHDLVRGKPGNFERAKKVIEFAQTSHLVDSLRIGCTVIRDNVYHLSDLLDFCIENGLYIKYRLGVPHQRLYTENVTEPYALTNSEVYEFIEFLEGLINNYEEDYLQKMFYRSLIDQLIYGSPRKAGCDWKHRGATITAKGELAYCAVKSKTLMNSISEGDPEVAYFENQDHLFDIIKNSCDDCNHDYVGIPDGREYLKSLLARANERFGIKRGLKKIPFFSYAQKYRSKLAFVRNIEVYRSVQEPIRVLSELKSNIQVSKVMICGWYGTETLGDKAILASIVDSLRSILGLDIKISVVSLNVYLTNITKEQMVELDGVNVLGLDQAISSVANYDYLLFGGGPVMALNELAPMQVLFERARKAKVKTIAAGVGVGPLGSRWHNKSIVEIINLCDIRIYRDSNSLSIAKSIGASCGSDFVAEDPALTWLGKFGRVSANKLEVTEKKEKILLLGLRDFPYQEYATDLSEERALAVKSNYESSIVGALEQLVSSDEGWVIKPLPMCTNHFGGDDRWFYRRLFRNNEALKPFMNYDLLGRELPPKEYVAAFQGADILFGMRFHSVVFGIGLGVRTIALDYTMGKGKVKALADRFDLPVLPMIGLSPNMIFDSINDGLERSEVIGQNVCAELKFESLLEKTILGLE